MFYLFYGIAWLIAWLPLNILYFFSDIFYLLVYYVAGYRKKIVRTNLNNSFPDKSIKEKRRIERKFYRFFCDTFFETIKKIHISEDEMISRMKFIHTENAFEQFNKGKSFILMTSHYGNWEWFTAFSIISPKNPVCQIYRKQKNKKFDGFMLELRGKFGTVNIEKRDTLRSIIRLNKEGRLFLYGFLSDQSPGANSIHYSTMFLNQKTPTLVGSEQIAKKFDFPVIYGKISRVKRGYYHFDFVPIALEPNNTKEFEITETYMRWLERDINEHPELWLWTHKRWKHAHLLQ